jgi:hypothetical protein
MTDPPAPAELEPSDSPQAALEGDLGTLSDDEYFQHLQQSQAAGIVGRDDQGNEYPLGLDVVDERADR